MSEKLIEVDYERIMNREKVRSELWKETYLFYLYKGDHKKGIEAADEALSEFDDRFLDPSGMKDN